MRWVTAAVVAFAVVMGLIVLRSAVYLPIPSLPESGFHDATSLPETIGVCGRTWHKDALARQFAEAQIVADFGVAPIVVSPGLFAPCPSGACTTSGGPCATVIWVRVDQDAYVDYSLSGGP